MLVVYQLIFCQMIILKDPKIGIKESVILGEHLFDQDLLEYLK